MSEWIDVDKEKPPIDLHVLLLAERDDIDWMFSGRWNGTAFEHAVGEEAGTCVTHWMKLPWRRER